MLRSFALASIGVVALTAVPDSYAKPCSGRIAAPALEEMLPRAQAALDIPGTEQVAVDAANRCIQIQVRTRGTARLVKLMLRGVDVPREAVAFRVVEPAAAAGSPQP